MPAFERGPAAVPVGIPATHAVFHGLSLPARDQEALNRFGVATAFTHAVENVLATYSKLSKAEHIDPSRITKMAVKALHFTEELARYYLHLHEYPLNIAVFGGVKLDKETHPDKYEKVVELGRLAVRHGLGVESGQGPGAMEASLLGGHLEFIENQSIQNLFPGRIATVGQKIIIGREPPNEFAHVSEAYDNFGVRKLALMGPDTVAFFVVEGGFGTMEELFEILTFQARGYIPARPVYLVGKEFWQGTLDMIQSMLSPEMQTQLLNTVKIIETDEFEGAIKECAKHASEIKKERAKSLSPVSDFEALVEKKYAAHYEWSSDEVTPLKFLSNIPAKDSASINQALAKITDILRKNDYSPDLAINLAKVFADHLYGQTIFAQFNGIKPISVCGSQKRFPELFEKAIELIHKISPETPVITRTANMDVGLSVHRHGLGGTEVTNHRLRYTLCAWPHLIENSRGFLFLPGGMDTMWGALTTIVAEQTNKPDLEQHPKKLVFDPENKLAQRLKGISDHVCAPQYKYARPQHADILKYSPCGQDPEQNWQILEEHLREFFNN